MPSKRTREQTEIHRCAILERKRCLTDNSLDDRVDMPSARRWPGSRIMSETAALPLQFTDSAASKVKNLIADEDNPNLKLRVYITGGGCSGFQYGFTFDDKVNEDDFTIEKQG
ncbi:Iron-sulfur cluster insertion protein ErpA [Sodalis praecaptivus]